MQSKKTAADFVVSCLGFSGDHLNWTFRSWLKYARILYWPHYTRILFRLAKVKLKSLRFWAFKNALDIIITVRWMVGWLLACCMECNQFRTICWLCVSRQQQEQKCYQFIFFTHKDDDTQCTKGSQPCVVVTGLLSSSSSPCPNQLQLTIPQIGSRQARRITLVDVTVQSLSVFLKTV